MQINDFKLERYFAEHEFKVRYLLERVGLRGAGFG